MTSPPQGPESVPPPYAPDAPYAQPAFSQQPKPTAPPKLSNIARLLAWITIGTGALLIIASWVIVLTTASAGSLMYFTSISSALWWIPRVVGLAAIVLGIVSLVRRERPVRRAVFGIIALPLVFVVDWGCASATRSLPWCFTSPRNLADVPTDEHHAASGGMPTVRS